VSEIPYGPTEAGAVVLEIGDGTGALVVRAPAELADRKIEISPSDQPRRRRHACVRERRSDGAFSYAAIYDRLPPGRYTIWLNCRIPAAAITVTGGQVASYDWPADHSD